MGKGKGIAYLRLGKLRGPGPGVLERQRQQGWSWVRRLG